jgi:hypothetical protein
LAIGVLSAAQIAQIQQLIEEHLNHDWQNRAECELGIQFGSSNGLSIIAGNNASHGKDRRHHYELG